MTRDSTLAQSPLVPPSFQREVLEWYRVNQRSLPWRGEKDPYRILVSEVMLQQTQVDRVKPKYYEFLERFPTLQSLAGASIRDVVLAWRGLGYNRRALNLKRTAEIVVREHDHKLPETVEALERLPGIGRYTARAVASFAFGQQVAVVDTNVRRVLSHFMGRQLSLREAELLAAELLPDQDAAEWNQALMDFGAMKLRAQKRPNRRPSEPFETSNRFWRGRIVEALRLQNSLSVPELFGRLPYPRDESRVRGLLLTLHEEGLVDYKFEEDTVSLPA